MNILSTENGNSLKDKVEKTFGSILNDVQGTVLWGGLLIAGILLMICIIKYYSAEDSVDRKKQVVWMRVIIVGYIALQLVTWFLGSYLSSKI